MIKRLFTILIFLLSFSVAHAADVSIVAPNSIDTAKQFTVLVHLSTDDVLVNSFDMSISYPKDLLTFGGYKESESIKKIWILSPKDEGGTIHFTGIIPGGVSGVYDPNKTGLQPIPLVALIFSPKGNGSGDFKIINSKILENDGKGTELEHNVNNHSFTVALPIGTEKIDIKDTTDTEQPLPFTVVYIPSGFFSQTPSLISFSTTDNNSGVKMYQLKGNKGEWIEVQSPLAVPRGLVEKSVIIRAVDYSGNSREASVDIPGILTSGELFVILLIFIICYLVFFVVKRRR